ncbi:MAG: helix-turn-helix transcriptional regulator [Anaerolineae bacterium]|nr:helix-turn-helix transcriptional regulator [Anaerolineae bacterium]
MPGQRHRCRRGQHGGWLQEPALLLLLHQGPAHGYTLVEQLNDLGIEGLNPRVVYRALQDMENNGWITSDWDTEQTQGPPRRVYSLTQSGNEALRTCIQTLHQTRGQIDGLINSYQRHINEGKGDYH